jgi:hypothetical protein
MFAKVSNLVCPPAPRKIHRLHEIVVDDGTLHEVVIHVEPKKLNF